MGIRQKVYRRIAASKIIKIKVIEIEMILWEFNAEMATWQ